MKKAKTADAQTARRQIVGVSLSPEIATEVKMEAARRGITVRALFIEMWTNYLKKKPT